MHRFLRYLRIAWTVFCGIACVLLIVLWVRSYQKSGLFVISRHAVVLTSGEIRIDRRWTSYTAPSGSWRTKPGDDISSLWATKEKTFDLVTGGISVPFWLVTILVLALAALPWLSWRFSLRTLLLAMTLVAVSLVVIVWLIR